MMFESILNECNPPDESEKVADIQFSFSNKVIHDLLIKRAAALKADNHDKVT